MSHLFVEGVSATLVATEIRGSEAISELYRFEVRVASTEALDLVAMIGAKAQIRVAAIESERTLHGLVTAVATDESSEIGQLYRVTIGPLVESLKHRFDCRIFQEMSVQEIVEEVLGDAGVPSESFQFDLSRPLAARDYCVQYRESDWDFIARLLEDEGVFYYFDHQEQACTLTFADDSAAHAQPIAGTDRLPYGLKSGLSSVEESVHILRLSRHLGVAGTALRDFNFTQPTMDLTSNAGEAAKRERYDYPGGYVSGSEGKRLAKLRLEAELAEQAVAEFESDSIRCVPGRTVAIDERTSHAHEELFQRYLILASHFDLPLWTLASRTNFGEKARLLVKNRALPEGVPYRPPRRTPRPRITGVQTAIVTGAEEIHTDEFGRIKVHFHWDRLGASDERSSCWLRVSQPWAGGAWGAIFLPRRGDEVLVEFLEGDPDRPIVTGRVYNGDAPTPYALPGERTKSTIRTRSSPEGDGFNELRFEDLKDQEEIYLHAQRDLLAEIENDARRIVGNDETIHVKHDRMITVDNNLSLEVGADKTTAVKGNHGETIDGDATITVHKSETYTVDADQTRKVGGSRKTTIEGSDADEVKGDRSEVIKGSRSATVDGDDALTVSGALSSEIRGDAKGEVKGALSLSVTGDLSADTKGALSLSATSDATIDAKGALSLSAITDATLDGLKIAITGKTELKLSCGGASITLKPSGEITLSGTKISVSGVEIKLSAPKISTM